MSTFSCGGQRRDQVEALEHEADLLARAVCPSSAFDAVAMSVSPSRTVPLVGRSSAPSSWRSVDLPPPVGPWIVDEVALGDLEVDAGERVDDAASLLIRARHAGEPVDAVRVRHPHPRRVVGVDHGHVRLPSELVFECSDVRIGVGHGHAHPTDRSASAGLSRAARQPPNAPAIRPPAIARPTAATMTQRVSGAVQHDIGRAGLLQQAAEARTPAAGTAIGDDRSPWTADRHRGRRGGDRRRDEVDHPDADQAHDAGPTAPPSRPWATDSPATWPDHAPVRPADRLERAELAGAPRDAGDGEQHGEPDRDGEHDDREPGAEVRDEGGRAGERSRDRRGEIGLRADGGVGQRRPRYRPAPPRSHRRTPPARRRSR